MREVCAFFLGGFAPHYVKSLEHKRGVVGGRRQKEISWWVTMEGNSLPNGNIPSPKNDNTIYLHFISMMKNVRACHKKLNHINSQSTLHYLITVPPLLLIFGALVHRNAFIWWGTLINFWSFGPSKLLFHRDRILDYISVIMSSIYCHKFLFLQS